jgi:hypothetical protein
MTSEHDDSEILPYCVTCGKPVHEDRATGNFVHTDTGKAQATHVKNYWTRTHYANPYSWALPPEDRD